MVMARKGRPRKRKVLEEPKKPISMLCRENHEKLMSALGHDVKTMSPIQQIDAIMMAIEKYAVQNNGDYLGNLITWNEQQEFEYLEKQREYRRSISPFECILNKAQMELLRTFFNEHLLETPIIIEELEDIFMGIDRGIIYRLKNWDLLILLFKGLSGDGFDNTDNTITYLTECFKPIEGHSYICSRWQKCIGDSKVFADKNGHLLTDGKIRRRLSTIKNVLVKVHIPVDDLKRLFEQIVKSEV